MSIKDKLWEHLRAHLLSLRPNGVVCMGQNLDTGSYIGGLSLCLKDLDESGIEIINTPNIETSLAGICLGATFSVDQAPAATGILFIKQSDFLTLMIDDLIHTINQLKAQDASYSLTIITFQVDSGYEGPQSRACYGQELSMLLDCPVAFIDDEDAVETALEAISRPGLRIIMVSQTCFANSSTEKLISQESLKFEKFEDSLTASPTSCAPTRTLVFLGASYGLLGRKTSMLTTGNIEGLLETATIWRLLSTNISDNVIAEVVKSSKGCEEVLIFDDSKHGNFFARSIRDRIRGFCPCDMRVDIFGDNQRRSNVGVNMDEIRFKKV